MDIETITLPGGQVLKYLKEKEVENNLEKRGFKEDVHLMNLERSDITTHVYEGGFKVWECSIDLCNLIEQNKDTIKDKTVIELGCGAGLPGILASIVGAKHVTFQDFNDCVLKCFTRDNALQNEVLIETISLVGCSWQNIGLVKEKSFDVILTSETIYNENDYESLHSALDYCLSADGVCWMAAKFFYFGLTGSVPSFLDYVKSQNVFSAGIKVSIEASVPRKILEIRRKA
ncbi:unnamed protein product [Auanema sp. JU1783]|nr:unnamed protein product [Auanema sp. JU1783]